MPQSTRRHLGSFQSIASAYILLVNPSKKAEVESLTQNFNGLGSRSDAHFWSCSRSNQGLRMSFMITLRVVIGRLMTLCKYRVRDSETSVYRFSGWRPKYPTNSHIIFKPAPDFRITSDYQYTVSRSQPVENPVVNTRLKSCARLARPQASEKEFAKA